MIKTFFKLSGATLITLLLLTACGGKTDTSALEQTIDSLRQANQQQQNSLQEMTTFVTTMSDGMNAIAQQENMIFNNGGNEGTSLDKEQLKSHLETLANTLTEQRSKIKALMPKGDFTKVNIYQFTELDIPTRSPKLLTDHPRKSYSIEKIDKENRKLVITNPQLFWSSSRYLIIQVK